jgi:hypothetical protein
VRGELVTYDWLVAEVARWRFMPDWTLEVRPPYTWPSGWMADMSAGVLLIRARVRDSRHPDNPDPVVVEQPVPVPGHLSREQFPHWLHHAVRDAIVHEADEWLQRDGVIVFDPHALPDRRAPDA